MKEIEWIGCAGWSIPKEQGNHFPKTGSHLERYAARFPAVEINTSFYRPHRFTTYARWAASVPPDFRFSVKVPKTITHVARMKGVEDALTTFLEETAGLGPKLGCLLVQIPPSLFFEKDTARIFFAALREKTNVPVAFEPRHESWSDPVAGLLLQKFKIARVAADPTPFPAAGTPAGWRGLTYYRLHGSPRIYYSAYSRFFVRKLAQHLAAANNSSHPIWCIFDNTALGCAIPNARQLIRNLDRFRFAALAKLPSITI